VPTDVSVLLREDGPFGDLVEAVRRDIEDDLRRGAPPGDDSRLAALEALTSIALLQGRLEDALDLSRAARTLQPTEERRLLTGVLVRPLVAAKRDWPDARQTTFVREFRRELDALPFRFVRAELEGQLANLELESEGLMVGLAERQMRGAVRDGRIPEELAKVVVEIGFVLREVLPFRTAALGVLRDVIACHEGEEGDIWGARAVNVAGGVLQPVVVAIWDSGLDERLFPGRLWTNPGEVPGNGRDDDGNGHVDDVHGIAWNWRGEPDVGLLAPPPVGEKYIAEAQRDLRAFAEMEAGVASSAAMGLWERLNALAPGEAATWLERMERLRAHGHGTHVAGIAASGNPAVRLLAIRMPFGISRADLASLEAWAHGQPGMIHSTIRYLVAAGARIVNMCWVPASDDMEAALQTAAPDLEAAERRYRARTWNQAIAEALRTSVAAAPEVLFVAVACEEARDGFHEGGRPPKPGPSNLITVGAADAFGDEVVFLRRAAADVHASGLQIASVVPGGEIQAWTGTSMAAAQVTNLAAKLLARWPDLTAAEVRWLIVEGADVKPLPGRDLHLLNPRRSFDLAVGRAADGGWTHPGKRPPRDAAP
jgi:hypothetical protein